MPALVLASASPQRHAILEELGIAHEVVPAAVVELAEGDPVEIALENARRKARDVAARPGCEGRAVLGADTVVAVEGAILPKPGDADAARRSLERLSGRSHVVAGGLCLISGAAESVATRVSAVTFRRLGRAEVDAYLATGEWRGRAGGYAIQGRGATLVAALEGELRNVIGLSAEALRELLGDALPPPA